MTHTYSAHIQTHLDPADLIDDAGIIPFADEEPHTAAISPLDLEESAHEEFGSHDQLPPRLSVVDQALDLEAHAQSKKRTGFICPCCQHSVTRAMRVCVATDPRRQARWTAVCAVCAASMLAKIPGTIVGGMIRPTRRRRPMRAQAAGQSPTNPRRNTRYRRAG